MVGVEGGLSEVAAICAIDFLTGEVLLQSLVKPQRRVTDWRSAISGMTAASMAAATAQKTVLEGWPAARDALFQYIDADTVLIGQSLNFDLAALGLVHSRVVDSAILTAEAVFGRGKKLRQLWGLQALCQELVGTRIRRGGAGSGRVASHDSLEDVLAAREVILCCLRNPETLEIWASLQRKKFQAKQRGRRQQRERKHEREASIISSDESEVECLRWEDVIDDDMWPKSPPDWDY
ncbi:exonuclease [Xylariales sp. PMI_506]|nr:exonuclease [Xylariales sp. PMI_506]